MHLIASKLPEVEQQMAGYKILERSHAVVDGLVDAYHPERIYLWGSSARVDHGPDSDYELLLAVPEDVPPERKRSRFASERLWGTGTAADVHVRTCLNIQQV